MFNFDQNIAKQFNNIYPSPSTIPAIGKWSNDDGANH